MSEADGRDAAARGSKTLAASAEPELRKGSTQYSRWHCPLNMEDVRKMPAFMRSHADAKRAPSKVTWQKEDKSGDEVRSVLDRAYALAMRYLKLRWSMPLPGREVGVEWDCSDGV